MKPVTVVLLCFIAGFHLWCAATGKPLFRAVHLGTALEYAHGPINILRPMVVGYDANDAPMAQEIPIWQAIVGGVLKMFGSGWYGWANVVSLAVFVMGLWPFYQIARRYAGEREAQWALVFYLAEPVVVFAAGLGSTDGFCLTVMLWFLFFADGMIRTGQARWWVGAVVLASSSAVSKLPFFMTAGFCSVAILWINGIKSWKRWGLLVSAGMIGEKANGTNI